MKDIAATNSDLLLFLANRTRLFCIYCSTISEISCLPLAPAFPFRHSRVYIFTPGEREASSV